MNGSEVTRDLESLKRDCEEAERLADPEWLRGWRNEIRGLLEYVENASPEERRSEKFNRDIWRNNRIANIGLGGLSNRALAQVVGSGRVLAWLAGMEPLPDNPERRAEILDCRRNEAVCLVRDLTGVQKWAAVTRLLAALFPRDFTSLVVSNRLNSFISYFNEKYPTLRIDPEVSVSDPEKHRQILKRLDDALGTVPEGDLEERVRRITLPYLLHELCFQEPSPEPQPADDSKEETTPQNIILYRPPTTPQNIILYGPPGTGKTYSTARRALELILGQDLEPSEINSRFLEYQEKGQIEFVTFHQSYGYEEFVEGLRPVLDEDEGGDVRYELHNGVFKRIALRAAAEGLPQPAEGNAVRRAQQALDQAAANGSSFSFSAETPQYVLIIDEINRGNVSKILGELITLLEPDKRLGADKELKLRLSYSPSHRFGVPPNLHIIGTMNTADRSIALIDVALRRRFTFEELMPDAEVICRELRRELPDEAPLINLVVDLCNTLNKRIRFLYDRDHQLGHAYFLEVKDLEDLRLVFVNRVIPLLQEYFYGDWHKICVVLGCPYDENDGKQNNDSPIVKASRFSEKNSLGFDPDEYEDRVDFAVSEDFLSRDRDRMTDNAPLARTFLGVLQIEGDELERRSVELTGSGSPSDTDEADEDEVENNQ